MRKIIFSVSPEHEVKRRLCGFASFDAAERRECGDNGRPEVWLALSGHRNIIQGPPAYQNTKTDHRVKVSPAALVASSEAINCKNNNLL